MSLLHTLRPRRLAATPAALQRAFSTSPILPKYARTPLYDFHTKPEHGGKMVEFAGWEMPLSYNAPAGANVAGGPVAEHHQVRKSSGLFDVGHMIQSTYNGPGALAFLSQLLPASLATLPVPKADGDVLRSTLSVLLNEEGGIIDDCMITRWGEESFYLVTNAGRAAEDLAWIESHLASWNASHSAEQVKMEVLRSHGLIALQGPSSHTALQRLLSPSTKINKLLTFSTSAFLPIPSLGPNAPAVHVARGGYTGEDGFEISVEGGRTEELASMLLEQSEVKLAGLAARDSLRLEAGLCLYGHDLNEGTGVGEAALGWVVGKDRRTPGSFIGSERTLKELKKGGTSRKRVGLVVEKGPAAREGAKIYSLDAEPQHIGTVTSGLPAPTVGKNISMGYISTAEGLWKKGSQVQVDIRGKMKKAEVVGMPWIEPGYFRGE